MLKKLEINARLAEGFKVVGDIRDHHVVIDQPTLAGGENAGPSPLEIACFALAACVLTIGRIVARQRRIELRGMTTRVEAEIDPDVYMGKGQDNRAGFVGYTVYTRIDADLSPEEKLAFLEEVDRRCPISENLQSPTPVHLALED